MTLSSALLALAPKCPICLFAYFGVFGVATTTVTAYRSWLPPLTALWLAVTVTMMVVGQRGKRNWGPPLIGLLAATAVFAGKFAFDQPMLVYAGIGVLAGAVVWNAVLGSRTPVTKCSDCVGNTLSLDQKIR